jgi:hypothetical protein
MGKGNLVVERIMQAANSIHSDSTKWHESDFVESLPTMSAYLLIISYSDRRFHSIIAPLNYQHRKRVPVLHKIGVFLCQKFILLTGNWPAKYISETPQDKSVRGDMITSVSNGVEKNHNMIGYRQGRVGSDARQTTILGKRVWMPHS